MQFNASKCKVMHIGRKNPCFSYTMGGHAPAGTVLETTDAEKDLGVIVHSSLKPTAQCAAAAKTANSVLGQMARSFTYRSKDTWLHLYRLYVRPHLEYSVPAWSPWIEADVNLLEAVQKLAVRMTSGLAGSCYEDRLKEVNMMSLVERRQRGDMIAVWKMLHGLEKVYVSKLFSRVEDYSARSGMRSSDAMMLVPQPARLEIRKNFFTNRAVKPWNALPTHVKMSSNIDSFKLNYDKYAQSLK